MPWLLEASWDVRCCVVKRGWSWFLKSSSTGLQHRNICSHVQKFANKTINFWPKWLAFYLFKSVKANNFPTRTAGKSVLASSFQHTFSRRNKGHACASFPDTTNIKYREENKYTGNRDVASRMPNDYNWLPWRIVYSLLSSDRSSWSGKPETL